MGSEFTGAGSIPLDTGAFIFDGVGMNYVHTPLNIDLMRGFLFCSLLWILMDSCL